jgi:hypothetical protein
MATQTYKANPKGGPAAVQAMADRLQGVVKDTIKTPGFTWANLGDLGRVEQGLKELLAPWEPDDAEQDQVVETAFDMLVQANGNARAAAATARRRARSTGPGAQAFWRNVAESIEDHGNLPGRS